MKAQMKEANRENARYTLIVGDQELENQVFVLRDMTESNELSGSFDELMTKLSS